jgi:hypothetical protein
MLVFCSIGQGLKKWIWRMRVLLKSWTSALIIGLV